MNQDTHGIFEAFAEAGYDPFYWHAHKMARANLGYGQGVPAQNAPDRELRASDPLFEQVLGRLERDPDYRAMVVTNLTITHGPYQPHALAAFSKAYPELYSSRETSSRARYADLYRKNHFALAWNFPHALRMLDLDAQEISELSQVLTLTYAANVYELDRRFGAILDAIDARGLGPHSLVAFTADHGEVLHNEAAIYQWSHSLQLAPEVLTVPWLLRAPGLPPCERWDTSSDGSPVRSSPATCKIVGSRLRRLPRSVRMAARPSPPLP